MKKLVKSGLFLMLLSVIVLSLVNPVSASENGVVVDSFEEKPTNISDYSKEEFIESLKESDDELIKFGLNNDYYRFEDDGKLVIEIPENPVVKNGEVAPFCIACIGGSVKITLQKMGSRYTTYGGWIKGVEGKGKATLTLSKTVGWANSYTGTLSTSVSALTATAGINATKTGSTTASYGVSVPAGKTYIIQYRKIYTNQMVEQTRTVGFNSTSSIITVKGFSHLGYRAISK